MDKISLIIPVFNEAKNIKLLIPQVKLAFKDQDFDFEIIVVGRWFH